MWSSSETFTHKPRRQESSPGRSLRSGSWVLEADFDSEKIGLALCSPSPNRVEQRFLLPSWPLYVLLAEHLGTCSLFRWPRGGEKRPWQPQSGAVGFDRPEARREDFGAARVTSLLPFPSSLGPGRHPAPRPASPAGMDPQLDAGSPGSTANLGLQGWGLERKGPTRCRRIGGRFFGVCGGAEPRTEFHGSGPREAARGTCANTGTLPGPECTDHSSPQPSRWTPRLLFLQWGGEGECDDLTRNTYPTVGSPIYNKQPISMAAAGFQRLY